MSHRILASAVCSSIQVHRELKHSWVMLFGVGMCLCAFNATAGFSEGEEAYQAGEYATSLKEWKPLASKGDVAAQIRLGDLYYEGSGVEQDTAEALRWYNKAAGQNNAEAQARLCAVYLDESNDNEKNIAAAEKWCQKSAKSGNAEAQYVLAMMYARGRGVKRNPDEARKWWSRAAEQGNAYAQYELGEVYAQGLEVKQDYSEALKWWSKSAEQGNADAQYVLGVMYEEGKAVPASHINALKWYKLAATSSSSIMEAERQRLKTELAEHPSLGSKQESEDKNRIVADVTEPSWKSIIRKAPEATDDMAWLPDSPTYFNRQDNELSAKAMDRLGKVYEYGELGEKVDSKLARIWYERAQQLRANRE